MSQAEELLARLRALVPELAAQAAEAEQLRRPTDASIQALEASGLFRLMVPRCYGGLELDLDTFLEAGLILAEADTSIAWVASFYVEHNWMFCQFPAAFQQELYADRAYVLAPAAVAPQGAALPENGGFRVRGRWQWGTGVMHASWAIVSAMTEPGDPFSMRFLALPRDEFKVDDTWHVDGMLATGSNDIVIDDAFVPAERSVPILGLTNATGEGARLHAGSLYRTPMVPILMLAASMPVVGQARAVVKAFREGLAERVRMNSPAKQAEKPAAQMRLARATLEAGQAEQLLRAVAAEVQERRGEASHEDRARWASSLTLAVHQARRVVGDVAQASGASAHFQGHALQRAVRDVNMAACHVAFDVDTQLELYGRVLLGFPPNSPHF